MTSSTKSSSEVLSIAAVIATAAIIGVGNAMLPPMIALRVEAAGLSTIWNGALAAMPALAIIATGAHYSAVIKQMGALRAFHANTALAVACILIFPMTGSYWMWVILRLIMGVTLGLQWVISESWINALAAGPRRGSILGIYVSVFCAGLAIGPLLLTVNGTSGYLPFLLCAATYTLCGLPLLWARPLATLPDHQKPMTIATVLRRAPAENIGSFVNGATWGSLLALLPLYAMHLGRQSSEALSFLTAMCLGSLVAQPIVGRAIDRISPRIILLVAGVVQVGVCLVLAPAIANNFTAWPLLLVWGAAIGSIYTAGLTGLGSYFSEVDQPAASTAFTLVWETGALSGPIIIGIAMRIWDPHGLALLAGVIGGALTLASFRRARDVAFTSS